MDKILNTYCLTYFIQILSYFYMHKGLSLVLPYDQQSDKDMYSQVLYWIFVKYAQVLPKVYVYICLGYLLILVPIFLYTLHFIKLFSLCDRIKNTKVRGCICSTSSNPLPSHCIICNISI